MAGGDGSYRDDVRERGFRGRKSVAEVLALVRSRVSTLAREAVPLLEAGDRVLARQATAQVDVPGFRRAAMDGWAVRGEETFGATSLDPCALRIVGESFPGRPAAAVVGEGECVRIMTGAPMPDGADAVVPFEESVRDGERALVQAAATPGRNVGEIGEDVRKGDVVLRAGRRLRPQDLGLLSSLGFAQVFVVRRPRVALVMTGDEILPAGSVPKGHAIADANTPMLLSLVRRDGGHLLNGPIVRDDRALVREALLASAAAADCVLVSGGSSVGADDHAPSLLREEGELLAHGIAMRPSSPAGFGMLAGKPVFLLPGNPVSCLCAYEFFAGMAIRTLGGRHPDWPHVTLRLPLGRKIASEIGRVDYVRVRVEQGRVIPLAIRGASILSSTTRAHGFVVVDADREGFGEGEMVEVRLY